MNPKLSVSLVLIVTLFLSACAPAPASTTEPPADSPTQIPPSATWQPTATTIPPSRTPKPPKFTNIVIDGNADDWADYPVNVTDPSGDQLAGQADLLEARFFMNDKYLYLLIKLENNGKWDDMAFAVGFAGNQNGQLNIRPSHHVDAGFYGEEFVDVPVSMEIGEFIEVKIPLDRFPAILERIDFIRVFNGGDLADDSQNGEHKPLSRVKETEVVASADGFVYSGELTLDTTWSGEVHVTGDITLSNGVILTIEPGTTIYLASNSDDTHRGRATSDSYIDSHQDPVGSAEWDQNAITIDGRNGTIHAIGTADQPIAFRPEGESTSSAQWDGIYIEKGTIQHAKVLYAGRTAIQIVSQKNDGSPKEQVEIAYNEVRFYHWAGIDSHTYNVWIHHNVVEGGGHQAMSVGSQSIAEYNFLTHCQNAMFIGGVDVIVRNNIAVDCARGLQISQPRIPAGSEISIINNTVVQLQGPPDGWYYQGKLVYPAHEERWAISNQVPNLKLNIQNNIISGPFNYGINFIAAPGSGSVVDYNLFWGVGQNFNGNNLGSHNLFSNPLLTNDFHLGAGSPAINAGAPGMTDSDGSPADLGAFGGDGHTSVGSSAPTSTPKPAPNFTPLPPTPSATATKPPTDSATSSASTTACLANETQLFADDFESGLDGWAANPGWKIVEDGGSKVLQSGPGRETAGYSGEWQNAVWRLRVKIESGRAQINIHWKDAQKYTISFATEWTQVLKFPGTQILNDTRLTHAANKWHELEISQILGALSVRVDGVDELQLNDAAPLGPGGLLLESTGGSAFRVDNIRVCQP